MPISGFVYILWNDCKMPHFFGGGEQGTVTFKFKLGRELCTMHLPTKFHCDCGSSSVVSLAVSCAFQVILQNYTVWCTREFSRCPIISSYILLMIIPVSLVLHVLLFSTLLFKNRTSVIFSK